MLYDCVGGSVLSSYWEQVIQGLGVGLPTLVHDAATEKHTVYQGCIYGLVDVEDTDDVGTTWTVWLAKVSNVTKTKDRAATIDVVRMGVPDHQKQSTAQRPTD